MANVDIKVFENISLKEKFIFDEFIKNNWDEILIENNPDFFDTPRLWVVGYKNNKIVGLFLIYGREIVFENIKIKMAGIGGVVTRIDCRRQGIMSQILQKFFSQYISKYKFDVAILCTDIKKIGKLYGRIGFMPINRSYFFIDKNGVEKEESGGMIIGLQNKNIVNKILISKTKLSVGDSNF
jgi:predicted acetyltransferase